MARARGGGRPADLDLLQGRYKPLQVVTADLDLLVEAEKLDERDRGVRRLDHLLHEQPQEGEPEDHKEPAARNVGRRRACVRVSDARPAASQQG